MSRPHDRIGGAPLSYNQQDFIKRMIAEAMADAPLSMAQQGVVCAFIDDAIKDAHLSQDQERGVQTWIDRTLEQAGLIDDGVLKHVQKMIDHAIQRTGLMDLDGIVTKMDPRAVASQIKHVAALAKEDHEDLENRILVLENEVRRPKGARKEEKRAKKFLKEAVMAERGPARMEDAWKTLDAAMVTGAVADAGALGDVKEGDITLEDLGRAYMAGWRRGRGEAS